MQEKADIGLIGLAVMGQNLVLNMNDRGIRVAVFNRTVSKVDDFLSTAAKGTAIKGAHCLADFFALLKRPRQVLLMVKAGQAVDSYIEQSLPFLEEGDVIIDGGNSWFQDSERRAKTLKEKGILFVATGISGGESGARFGPSIMPGGDSRAWPLLKPIFTSIAAKAQGDPCCEWVGEGGAGHYVKMVHNGIEYGDMQLICEIYDIMKRGLGLSHCEMAGHFQQWNEGVLSSYLIEITHRILSHSDDGTEDLLDRILDVAGQKGTGKWMVTNALDLGEPLTLIAESVFARSLSCLKEERERAAALLSAPCGEKGDVDHSAMLDSLKEALYAAKIMSYAQGFNLMKRASCEYGWSLDFASLALMWREGCIIRSQFLGEIKRAFTEQPDLPTLLLDPFFKKALEQAQSAWRKVVVFAVEHGIPIPALSAALTFYDGYRSQRLPANLLQAQRDFFGAHTYERTDHPRGEFFHTEWEERCR